ncbi:hypothetical protein BCPG1_085 [Bacillus phage BCPG1]|uniref:Uncharacterized protein n=1 Tax=Bacillus phage SalinJah TaxID=1837830 RepID=A0A173GBQ5_9CAUD|nr:hypothetical protein SALINJAH_158 [Bacillus phage SalinJah]ANH50578.1 hypothetical protein SALINJAH_158 [Bacillus phage SalinJah]QQO38816.1 hypothetical protein BCPG1_085 [Bacillus phage BCPG1]QSJ04698.1 hypothetical protein BCP18_166 [Bacillus phage BCP18]
MGKVAPNVFNQLFDMMRDLQTNNVEDMDWEDLMRLADRTRSLVSHINEEIICRMEEGRDK